MHAQPPPLEYSTYGDSYAQVATLAFLNLFHGVPFIVLVGVYCRRRWAVTQPRCATDGLTRFLTRWWSLFILALVALAAVEETLWDLLVWRTGYYATPLATPLSPAGISLATAALSTPQVLLPLVVVAA